MEPIEIFLRKMNKENKTKLKSPKHDETETVFKVSKQRTVKPKTAQPGSRRNLVKLDN